ncbi:MAG: alpha/beta hydrolase [Noviherbaspirillum sp.]|nr:alpha/beta hydrolase [Noviherbaspirillum sp.]
MTAVTHNEHVRIPIGDANMDGMMWLPEDHIGIILFAHSGTTNRIKPPNDYVASVLRDAHMGTLWLDLLSEQETKSHRAQSDIGLLTERLDAACNWLLEYAATEDLPIGLFGAGNCAAAALQVAAARGRAISALVSRGGRPDLACQDTLGKISAPTLLIVGGLDDGGIETNRNAYAALRCKKRFEIIPGATHSFEEPGNLEVVARLARGWFLQHNHFCRGWT